jgi:hypothetical protein
MIVPMKPPFPVHSYRTIPSKLEPLLANFSTSDRSKWGYLHYQEPKAFTSQPFSERQLSLFLPCEVSYNEMAWPSNFLYGFCFRRTDFNKGNMQPVRGFYISLLIHAAILVLLLLLPKPEVPQSPLTFEILPKQTAEKHTTIVRDLDLPDSQSHPKDEDHMRFWSEKTRTVREETRARNSGLTKNRAQNSQASRAQQRQSQVQVQMKMQKPQRAFDKSNADSFMPDKIEPPTAEEIAQESAVQTPAQRPQPQVPQMQESRADIDLERGLSTLAEDLPNDMKVGSITAVDTDRYLYYTYFARAQELVWNEWAPMVQSLLSSPPASLRMGSQGQYSTFLEVWFYPNGQVHSTHLLKPSGIPEFDYVASTSFKRIGMIPNPPREKIDPDGLIRFKWALTVEYDPKVLVRK